MTEFITRAQWGAQPPKGSYSTIKNTLGTAIHWPGNGFWATLDPRAAMRKIQQIHFDHPTENYIDIAYNLGVAPGIILEGRSVFTNLNRRSGANGTFAANSGAFAVVALHGGADGEPSDLLLQTIAEAVNILRHGANAQPDVLPHQKFVGTECPGVFVKYLPKIRAYADGTTVPVPPPTPPVTPPLYKPKIYGNGVVWWDRLAFGVSNSDSVRNLQQRLIDLGYLIPAGPTGNYGNQTKSAVASFQRKQGWSGSDADGLIYPGGRVTTSRLFLYNGSPYTVRWDKS